MKATRPSGHPLKRLCPGVCVVTRAGPLRVISPKGRQAMKKPLTVVASVALLWLWLQRKYKAVVEEGQRRQGRSGVVWKMGATPQRQSGAQQKVLIPQAPDF